MELSLRFLFMMMYTPTAMAVSLWRPFWGLLMLVFLYYFRPDIWGAPDWFRPILWITIAVGIGWATRLRTFRFHPIMAVSILVLLGALASALAAKVDREIALDGVWIIAKLMIVQFLTMQLVDSPARIRQFLWANVLGMLWNLKTILVVGATGGDFERVNVAVGQGGGANYLAWVLIMMMPFLFSRFTSGSRRERLVVLWLFPLYVLGAVFTGSRSGILQLGAVMGYLVIRSNRKVLGFATGLVAATILFLALPQSEWDRFKQGLGSEDQRDFSAQSRILLWRAAWTMFREDPILGKGQDNFQLLSPRYAGFFAGKTARRYEPGATGRGFVAHNTWFQALAEGGVVVGIPFLALFPMVFLTLRRVRRRRLGPAQRRFFTGVCLSLEGLFVGTIVASTFGSHIKIDFLWWFLGLVAAVQLTADETLFREGAAQRAEALRRRRDAWKERVGEAAEPETVGG